ncbi:unnamed protein product, partial [Cyprideis torosa]
MIVPYDAQLMQLAKDIAADLDIVLHEGVYASVVGPQLETRAEYKYLSIIGADAVGMSTVPEVIVANHERMKVLAFSVLTDECDPKRLKPLNIDEIIEAANQAQPKLTEIIMKILGGHLGQRMQNAFKEAFEEGYKKVIIIGSDNLDIDASHILEASKALDRNAFVLGPAADGGYYLLGMTIFEPSLFEDMAWGT